MGKRNKTDGYNKNWYKIWSQLYTIGNWVLRNIFKRIWAPISNKNKNNVSAQSNFKQTFWWPKVLRNWYALTKNEWEVGIEKLMCQVFRKRILTRNRYNFPSRAALNTILASGFKLMTIVDPRVFENRCFLLVRTFVVYTKYNIFWDYCNQKWNTTQELRNLKDSPTVYLFPNEITCKTSVNKFIRKIYSTLISHNDNSWFLTTCPFRSRINNKEFWHKYSTQQITQNAHYVIKT